MIGESRAPDETLDARGLLCPLPLVLAAKRLRSAAGGFVLEVFADDPAAPGDFREFCSGGGAELLGVVTVPGARTVFSITIRKT